MTVLPCLRRARAIHYHVVGHPLGASAPVDVRHDGSQGQDCVVCDNVVCVVSDDDEAARQGGRNNHAMAGA